jgi:hypothetical protein
MEVTLFRTVKTMHRVEMDDQGLRRMRRKRRSLAWAT